MGDVIKFKGKRAPAPSYVNKHVDVLKPFLPISDADNLYNMWRTSANDVKREAFVNGTLRGFPSKITDSIVASEVCIILPDAKADVGGVRNDFSHSTSGKPTWTLQFDAAYLFDVQRSIERGVNPVTYDEAEHVRTLNQTFLTNLMAGLVIVDTAIETSLLSVPARMQDRLRFTFAGRIAYDAVEGAHAKAYMDDMIEEDIKAGARHVLADVPMSRGSDLGWTAPRSALVTPMTPEDMIRVQQAAVHASQLRAI
jgi:hypothetical protein